jgi:hypothetical protein
MPTKDEMEARMARLENGAIRQADDIEALKLLLEKNNTSLGEFVEIAKVFKFGMKALAFMEKCAVFVTKITLAAGTLWAGWKFLVKEAVARALENLK